MINFVKAGRNKKCHYSWEACSEPWEQLGFLNIYDFLVRFWRIFMHISSPINRSSNFCNVSYILEKI